VDKDRSYTEVAKSLAAAAQLSADLQGVLLAGVDRAQALVQEAGG